MKTIDIMPGEDRMVGSWLRRGFKKIQLYKNNNFPRIISPWEYSLKQTQTNENSGLASLLGNFHN